VRYEGKNIERPVLLTDIDNYVTDDNFSTLLSNVPTLRDISKYFWIVLQKILHGTHKAFPANCTSQEFLTLLAITTLCSSYVTGGLHVISDSTYSYRCLSYD
jgi:hypothetical protein